MHWLEYKNIETANTLSVCLDQKAIKYCGKTEFIQDIAVYESLLLIAKNGNDVTTYDSLCDVINRVKKVGSDSESTLANKYVFKIRKALKSISVSNFVINVRNNGYRIADNWILLDGNQGLSNGDEFLTEIRAIIDDCINYSQSVEITHDRCGLSYIVPSDQVLLNNFRRMNACYHIFMRDYSKPGNSAQLMEVRNKLNKLLSYCIFWRVGDGLTDEKWKSDYRNELEVLLKQIETNVNLID